MTHRSSFLSFHWGRKIALLYLGFVALIVTLVWKSTHVKLNLVSEDYYAQELSFQTKLDAENAAAQLEQKPVLSLAPDAILVFFPQSKAGKAIDAELHFYNPADAALDKAFSHLHPQQGQLRIDRTTLADARFIAKLSWTCEGKAYYQELPLNLSSK